MRAPIRVQRTEYANARAAADELRKDLERAIYVSFMFPDEAEWANDCVARVCAQAKKDPEAAYYWNDAAELLVTSVSDPAHAAALFEAPLNVDVPAAFVPTIIDNLGAAAAALLRRDRLDLGEKKEGAAAVQAFAMIETPAAAAVIAELADEPGAIASATEWAQRLPDLARPALEQRAAAERKSQAAKIVALLRAPAKAAANPAAAPVASAPTRAARAASEADLDETERVAIPDAERARLLLPRHPAGTPARLPAVASAPDANADASAAARDVGDGEQQSARIDAWASAHGFAGMLRRLVEWGRLIPAAQEREGTWGDRFYESVWARVRVHMSEASDDDYAKALAFARSLYADAPEPLKNVLSFTFPDEASFVPPPVTEAAFSALLLASVRSPEHLARIVESAANDSSWNGAPAWVASDFRAHAVANVVDVLGAAALPHLERMLSDADRYIASQNAKPAYAEMYRRHFRVPVLAGFAWIESRASLKRAIGEMGDWSRRPVAWDLAKRRPALALLAALELASEKKLAPHANEVLAWLHFEHADLVAKMRARLSPAEQKTLDRARVEGDLPPWLAAPPPSWKAAKAPGFWSPALLPAIELRTGGTLTAEQLETVRVLLTNGYAGPQIELEQLRTIAREESLTEFALALFRAWLEADGPPKEKWAFCGPAWFAGDRYATEITPLVRAWPGQRLAARAEIGLEVLENIGTDLALMYLNGIAEKSKFEGITNAARERIEAIARRRGLTADELADRLVPDLGLDAAGTMALDFGPRKFVVRLDEHLEPVVQGADGATLADLPKAKKDDDAKLAKEAHEAFKVFKKDAKELVTRLRHRLETTMCAGRAVAGDAFRALFVAHPLVGQLARRVVWMELREDGTRLPFRVAEDGSLADARDAEHALAPGSRITVAHPIDMAADDVARFATVFAEYRIVQPIEQLGRFVARDDAAVQHALARVVGKKVAKSKVYGLPSRGWRRGPVEDNGFVHFYERRIGGCTFALHFGDGGLPIGDVDRDVPDVEIESIVPDAARLDARLRSELARDLAWLGEK